MASRNKSFRINSILTPRNKSYRINSIQTKVQQTKIDLAGRTKLNKFTAEIYILSAVLSLMECWMRKEFSPIGNTRQLFRSRSAYQRSEGRHMVVINSNRQIILAVWMEHKEEKNPGNSTPSLRVIVGRRWREEIKKEHGLFLRYLSFIGCQVMRWCHRWVLELLAWGVVIVRPPSRTQWAKWVTPSAEIMSRNEGWNILLTKLGPEFESRYARSAAMRDISSAIDIALYRH